MGESMHAPPRLLDVLGSARAVPEHRPWPRAVVNHDDWRRVTSSLSSGDWVLLGLWAALAFVTGYSLLTMGNRGPRKVSSAVRRGFGVLALVYGVALLVGALSGRTDPLQPLAGLGTGGSVAAVRAETGVAFKRIKSTTDLEREVATASAAGRPVMLDFYADWCVSCKEMETRTFSEAAVRGALSNYVLLRADVTANDDDDQALLKRFRIIGPPTTAFFAPVDSASRRSMRPFSASTAR